MKNTIPNQILRIPFACVLAIAALASLPLHAATVTWDGATDMNWTQPDSTSWNATYNSGDTAQFLGAGAGTVTIDAGGVTPGAVIVNSSANYTFTGGAIGNNGTTTLSKNGTGTLTLSNANTYTGLTTVSGGVLDVGVMSSNAVSNSSGIFISNNATLQGSGTFTRALVDGITPGAGQVASAAGGFAARGGQLTVTFSNNSSAEIGMWSSGQFGTNLGLGSTSADSKVVVTNNINLNTSGQRVVTVTAGVGGAEATSAELSGVIRNSNVTNGGITKRGNGLLILSSTANSFDGLTSIEAGTLSIASIKSVGGGNSSLGAVTTSDKGRIFISSGGTLRYTGTGDTTDRRIFLSSTSGNVTLDQSGAGLLKFTSNIGGADANTGNKTFILQGSTTGTGEISGNILDPAVTGNLGVTKTGTGTWTLSGNNTYSGQTTVTNGVLDVGVIGAGGLSANSGLFLGESATGATTGILQGSGTFTRSLSGNTTPTSAQVSGRNAGFAARGGDLTVNLGGAAAQIVMNAGGQAFGTNLVFGSSSADSKVVFANAIDLNTTLNSQRIITVNAGVGGAAATSAEMQGVISNGVAGANGIIKRGNGTLILTGSNAYTGNTTVDAGTLQIGNGGANGSIDATGAVSIAAGSRLDINRTGSLSVGNAISGAGGVRQLGAGTTTLFNTNTYTGATTVSAGTLLINGSTAADSAVSVNSGGTLGGTGTVGGTITVNSGGTLSPGSSIESLASGSNTWNGGGALTFEFSTNGSTGAAGTEWDLLSITGGLNLSGASSGTPFTLNLVTMANATTPGLLATWNPNVSATWAGFVTTTTGVTAFAADKFAFNTAGFQNSRNGSFAVALNGSNLDLVYTAVPEPTTWALLAFSLTTIMVLRRRRQS